MLTAAVLYARAVESAGAGRHSAAWRDLDAAETRSPDPDLAARILGTRAYLAGERGDPDAGIAFASTALADRRISPHTRAVVTSQLGLIELRRGNASEALEYLSAAASRLGDDPGRLARVLLNRGVVRLDRSELIAAQSDFAAAAAAYTSAGEPVGAAKAHGNQGYAAMLVGDLVGAMRLLDDSHRVLSELSPVIAAGCDVDRAEVLLAAGMSTEAVPLLRNAAKIYGSRRLRQDQAEAEQALARALAVEKPTQAAKIARRAARRFRSRGNETAAVRADAIGAECSLAAGRATPTILASAHATAEALDALRRPDPSAALRLQLARALAASGAEDQASATLRRVRMRPSFSITTRILAGEVRAEIAGAAGRTADALNHARNGIDELQEWIATFGSLELQSGAISHGKRLAVLGIRAAVETGSPRLVFEWSERVRALSSTVVSLRPPADPQVANELAELRALRAESPRPGSADAAREAALRESIRRHHWTDGGRGAVGARSDLDDVIAAAGDDDAALIAHLWTEDRLSALVISGGHAHTVDLGAWAPVAALLDGLLADLDMSAVMLPSSLSRAVDAALAARLRRLDSLLVEPIAGLLGNASRIVLTPAGALAGIPWNLLGGLAERAVTVPSSASEWMHARAGAARLSSAGFAAGPDVERAESEVRQAAASWTSPETFVGERATASAVSGLAERVDLLHVAAHGRHSADNPLFSAFELADGAWFGYDIDQLEHVPSVVVLSACELGRSASRWGLEALGMSRAWLHAGARAVISSPSAVADADAAALLTAAHEHLGAGVGPSEALAAAARSTGVSAPFLVHGSGW